MSFVTHSIAFGVNARYVEGDPLCYSHSHPAQRQVEVWLDSLDRSSLPHVIRVNEALEAIEGCWRHIHGLLDVDFEPRPIRAVEFLAAERQKDSAIVARIKQWLERAVQPHEVSEGEEVVHSSEE